MSVFALLTNQLLTIGAVAWGLLLLIRTMPPSTPDRGPWPRWILSAAVVLVASLVALYLCGLLPGHGSG